MLPSPAATASDAPAAEKTRLCRDWFAGYFFTLPLGESDAAEAGEGHSC